MRLSKRIKGLLALGLCVCFTVLAFYILYLSNWNALYIKKKIFVESNKQMLGKTIGHYSSEEEALRENAIKEYKVWSIDGEKYILGTKIEDDTVEGLGLYKIDFKSNRYSLVLLPNNISVEQDIELPFYDGYWCDGLFCMSIMGTWHSVNPSKIMTSDSELYYGIWIGNDIKRMTVSKGNLTCEKIDLEAENGKDCFLWTYEIDSFEDILKVAGDKKVEVDKYGDIQNEYYEYRLIDVKKELGVEYETENSNKVIIYWIVTVLVIIASLIMIWISLRANSKEVILWLLSILLACVSIFLILMYVYNPDLIFGINTINGIIHKLSGHYIPTMP